MKNILFSIFIITIGLFYASCEKEEEENEKSCLELTTTASFVIDGTAFEVTHTPVWNSSGIYQSLGFRHDYSSGGQEIVTIIFEGDTTGTYALESVSDSHRATYIGQSSGGSALFTGPGQTGTLTITDIDLSGTGCLSGTYEFTANYVQVSGEFQSLRIN